MSRPTEDVPARDHAPSIEVRSLRKVFYSEAANRPTVAVDGLDFSVQEGELVCIVGRTGCGKSTLFNILAGLEEPTGGQVSILGRQPAKDFHWYKGKLGIIFQSDRLLPWRRARENVELGLEMLGQPPNVRRRTAELWLKRLGLGDFLDAYPAELSGGMKQRVAMARAFALQPRIVLADEAFGHLDEVTARRLREDFKKLARSERITVVLITHQLDEAIQFGDRILVFGRPGRVLLEVEPAAALKSESEAELRLRLQRAMDEEGSGGATEPRQGTARE